jgi:hypothetical protein
VAHREEEREKERSRWRREEGGRGEALGFVARLPRWGLKEGKTEWLEEDEDHGITLLWCARKTTGKRRNEGVRAWRWAGSDGALGPAGKRGRDGLERWVSVETWAKEVGLLQLLSKHFELRREIENRVGRKI